MKSGHSFWAKRREGGGVIDLHELFINYWSSKNQEFTVLSQSIITNQSPQSSSNRTEPVVIGKHSGSIEMQFSANHTVRTFSTVHPRQLIIFA